jgi:hypothetical protein
MRHFIENYPTAGDEEMYAWFGAHAGKFMEMASRCRRRRFIITADNYAGLGLEIA